MYVYRFGLSRIEARDLFVLQRLRTRANNWPMPPDAPLKESLEGAKDLIIRSWAEDSGYLGSYLGEYVVPVTVAYTMYQGVFTHRTHCKL